MVWRYPQVVPGHPAAANGPLTDHGWVRPLAVSPLAELSLPALRLSESGAAIRTPWAQVGPACQWPR